MDEIEDLQSKVKQVRLVEKLGEKGFHYKIKEPIEPITKAVTDSNQKLLEETKSYTKANEVLKESNIQIKHIELMKRNGVIDSILIRPIAKYLVPSNKSQFRLHDGPDSDNWNDYIMNGEKVTNFDNKLVFKNSGKNFTLRGDALKMITDYKFKTTDSPDAKLIIDMMDEIFFDIRSLGKSLRVRDLKKTILIKEE